MNLNDLKQKIAEKDGLLVCPICGLPVHPYHRRQKTCGDPECVKRYHMQYVRDYNRRRRAERPEAVREYNKLKMRMYRRQKRDKQDRDRQLAEVERRWDRQIEFERKIAEYGYRYGEVQKQKTLDSVPKINVNMEEKHDNIHDKNDRKGGE